MARGVSAYQALADNVLYNAAAIQARYDERLLATGDTATGLTLIGGDTSAAGGLLQAGYVSRTTQSRIGDHPTVFDFVTASDSTSDYGPAINRCLAAGYGCDIPTILPVATPLVNGLPGALLFGRDRAKSGLTIPTSAASAMYAAGGLISSTGLALGPTVRDLTLNFTQPSTGTSWINYGPAITLANTARARLTNLRILTGWDGIKVTGDTVTGGSGGLICENLESSCLGTNVALDGCYDTVRFINPHIWPFGMITDGGQPLHANYVNLEVQLMNSASGYVVGRVDNLIVDNGLTIMVNALSMSLAADGSTFGTFSNHDFDTFGGVNLGAALMTFDNCAFTVGVSSGSVLIANAGTNFTYLNDCILLINAVPSGTSGHAAVQVGAGSRVAMNGGAIHMAANTTAVLADGAGTTLSLNGVDFELTPAGTYTSPIVLAQNGARIDFTSNSCVQMTSTGVTLLSVIADNAGIVDGNAFGSTALSLGVPCTKLRVGINAGLSSPYPIVTVATPATGTTVAFAANAATLLIEGSATLASLAVTLPTAWYPNEAITVSSMVAVTAVTFAAGSTTINGAPTSLAAGKSQRFLFNGGAYYAA